MKSKPTEYLTNKQLLREIHRCKSTYCYFVDDQYRDYDIIVRRKEEITPQAAVEYCEELLAKKKIEKSPEDVVFRLMTYQHIPKCEDKKKMSRAAEGKGHLRVNFPPFSHYILKDGVAFEVARSHWKNGLENGHFDQEHGRMSETLAAMFITLVDRYARKSNWRNYSYNDEMKGAAMLQLSMVGLRFDESKGSIPFAFYTQIIKNCFRRVLGDEKDVQNTRDDILIMNGAQPSYTRQIEDELGHKFSDQGKAPTIIRRGRKSASQQKREEDL